LYAQWQDFQASSGMRSIKELRKLKHRIAGQNHFALTGISR
jgi:hypothetical protein